MFSVLLLSFQQEMKISQVVTVVREHVKSMAKGYGWKQFLPLFILCAHYTEKSVSASVAKHNQFYFHGVRSVVTELRQQLCDCLLFWFSREWKREFLAYFPSKSIDSEVGIIWSFLWDSFPSKLAAYMADCVNYHFKLGLKLLQYGKSLCLYIKVMEVHQFQTPHARFAIPIINSNSIYMQIGSRRVMLQL